MWFWVCRSCCWPAKRGALFGVIWSAEGSGNSLQGKTMGCGWLRHAESIFFFKLLCLQSTRDDGKQRNTEKHQNRFKKHVSGKTAELLLLFVYILSMFPLRFYCRFAIMLMGQWDECCQRESLGSRSFCRKYVKDTNFMRKVTFYYQFEKNCFINLN